VVEELLDHLRLFRLVMGGLRSHVPTE
jgi:hypothetical protein